MKKYRNNKTGKVAILLSYKAAGMCDKLFGITMVIYNYEGDDYDYPFVMENREFFETHSEITN